MFKAVNPAMFTRESDFFFCVKVNTKSDLSDANCQKETHRCQIAFGVKSSCKLVLKRF